MLLSLFAIQPHCKEALRGENEGADATGFGRLSIGPGEPSQQPAEQALLALICTHHWYQLGSISLLSSPCSERFHLFAQCPSLNLLCRSVVNPRFFNGSAGSPHGVPFNGAGEDPIHTPSPFLTFISVVGLLVVACSPLLIAFCLQLARPSQDAFPTAHSGPWRAGARDCERTAMHRVQIQVQAAVP